MVFFSDGISTPRRRGMAQNLRECSGHSSNHSQRNSNSCTHSNGSPKRKYRKSHEYSSRILFSTPAAVCGEDQRRQQRRHLAFERSCTFHTFGERWREPSYNSSWWATDHAFNSFRVTGEIGNDSWETAEYREKPAAITRGGLISGKFRNRLPRNDCNSELNQRFRS